MRENYIYIHTYNQVQVGLAKSVPTPTLLLGRENPSRRG